MDQHTPTPTDSSADFDAQASQLAELGSLATLLAHEINGQMTSALGHIQLALRNRHLSPAPDHADLACQTLEQVLSIIKRTTVLTESMMRYARPAPQAELEPFACDVREAHEIAHAFIAPTVDDATTTQYEFECNTQGACAQIDPISLEQIFINLYMNAERAIADRCADDPEAPRTVLVNATLESSTWNTPHIRISIQDSGQGIDLAAIPSIFKPWNRSEPASNSEGERSGGGQLPTSPGHGLGLAVCEKLVLAAGGTIVCDSTPGIGTTFTIVIPAAAASGNAQPSHTRAAA